MFERRKQWDGAVTGFGPELGADPLFHDVTSLRTQLVSVEPFAHLRTS